MNSPEFADVLTELGVTRALLTDAQQKQLDTTGYLVLPGLIDPVWLESLREIFDGLVAKEGASAGHEVHQEEGTRRLSDLVNKDAVFDGIYIHPVVLAAVYRVLQRPFKLSSLNAREALAGHGLQGLHADWGARQDASFHVCNSLWLLDDYTPDNGCTRVVPGSHLLPGGPKDHLENPQADHPDQVLLTAKAGTVVVFNSHLWHGGTHNRSGARRRVCHCYFTAREHPQQLNQADHLRVRTWQRISPAARVVLDVERLVPGL